MKLQCRFHPQAWIGDYAVSVDPQGTTDWEVEFTGELPGDDSYESDILISEGSAPEWIKSWCGPFYVEIVNREELTCK